MATIHPIIVHFVILILALSVMADGLYILSQKEKWLNWASRLLFLGTFCALVAVLSGGQAFATLDLSGDVKQLVRNHRSSGQLSLVLFGCLSIFRLIMMQFNLFQKPIKWGYYLLTFLAITFLFRTGLLGGNMVYFHGVGVDQSEPKPPLQKPSFE